MTSAHHQAIEWDVSTWGRALVFWEQMIETQNIQAGNGLEIGARNGGLSWYFAHTFGSKMCCTDYDLPSEKARLLHSKEGVESLISYQSADATQLPFPTESFDFVVFKSVLGAIGRDKHPEKQQLAIAEMHRVLKPGGVLFFAENLQASRLHQWMRRAIRPWGIYWRYVTMQELHTWLAIFAEKEVRSTGFLAAFVPTRTGLKPLAASIDLMLEPLPSNTKYVAYGFARKQQKTT